jgi:hypothetical protein
MMYCLLYKVFGYPFSNAYVAIKTFAFVLDLWMTASMRCSFFVQFQPAQIELSMELGLLDFAH